MQKKVICWEKFKSLVGSIIFFMYFVCFFVVDVVIDVVGGVGIVGTCGVVWFRRWVLLSLKIVESEQSTQGVREKKIKSLK